MKSLARILWIDDAFGTAGTSSSILRLLQRSEGIKASGCHPNHVEDQLNRLYDLYLVDYRLNKEPDIDNARYPHTGISIAGLVRDKFPDVPIYLTSALLEEDDFKRSTSESELFDRLISHKSLTRPDGREGLRSDALDFSRIRSAKSRQGLGPIHALLRSPRGARADIARLLPESLQTGLGARQRDREPNTVPTDLSPGTIRFGKWVLHQLLVYPGVLYDALYAATYLGMTESYFASTFFKKALPAKYIGVFSRTSEDRWWKSSLTELVILDSAAKKFGALRFVELAPKVLRVPTRSQPKCEVCGRPFPDTVAYDRDDHSRRGPAHISCSEPDPARKPVLYFEPFRVFTR